MNIKSDETMSKILAAAREVFGEAGFAGARVDAIARRAGVNKAMLYYHYGDKKALYAAVLHDVLGNVAAAINAKIAGAKSPEEKIRVYIQTMARAMEDNPQMPRIMLREIAAGSRNLPKVFFQDIWQILENIQAIIQEGVGHGVFVEASPLAVHAMVIGTLLVEKTGLVTIIENANTPEEFRVLGRALAMDLASQAEILILRSIKAS